MSLGITIPFEPALAEHGPILRSLLDAGYDELWTAETAGADAFGPLMAAAGSGVDARLGTAIASVFSRGPALLAMQAAALADAAPGRAAVGIGASSAAMGAGWNDRPYHRPLQRVLDVVDVLRRALAGERVAATYETFAVDRFTLERVPAVPPRILVGALGPRMLAAGARSADGVVLNWIGADDATRIAAHLDAEVPGAEPEVVARIFVCPSTDADAVRSGARGLIARYLSVPGYAASQRWLGRGDALGPMWDRWAAGERAEAMAAIPDDVVDELIVHGTPEACAAHLQRYVAAGVTTPVVKVLPLVPGLDALAGALDVARAWAAAGR